MTFEVIGVLDDKSGLCVCGGGGEGGAVTNVIIFLLQWKLVNTKSLNKTKFCEPTVYRMYYLHTFNKKYF